MVKMKNTETLMQNEREYHYELKIVLHIEKSETVFSEGDS